MGLSYEPMPVPASYNDVGQDKALRDHVGWAWYQKAFYVPTAWKSKRIMLYFGSAHYNTIVVTCLWTYPLTVIRQTMNMIKTWRVEDRWLTYSFFTYEEPII